MMLVVKNPPANAGDTRDAGSILVDTHKSRSSYLHVSDILSSVELRFLQWTRRTTFGVKVPNFQSQLGH